MDQRPQVDVKKQLAEPNCSQGAGRQAVNHLSGRVTLQAIGWCIHPAYVDTMQSPPNGLHVD